MIVLVVPITHHWHKTVFILMPSVHYRKKILLIALSREKMTTGIGSGYWSLKTPMIWAFILLDYLIHQLTRPLRPPALYLQYLNLSSQWGGGCWSVKARQKILLAGTLLTNIPINHFHAPFFTPRSLHSNLFSRFQGLSSSQDLQLLHSTTACYSESLLLGTSSSPVSQAPNFPNLKSRSRCTKHDQPSSKFCVLLLY